MYQNQYMGSFAALVTLLGVTTFVNLERRPALKGRMGGLLLGVTISGIVAVENLLPERLQTDSVHFWVQLLGTVAGISLIWLHWAMHRNEPE